MSNVVRLPSAAVSYYTVRKFPNPGWWSVVLVTPIPGRPSLVTRLCQWNDREVAIAEAKRAAERAKRPFREPRRRA